MADKLKKMIGKLLDLLGRQIKSCIYLQPTAFSVQLYIILELHHSKSDVFSYSYAFISTYNLAFMNSLVNIMLLRY